MPKTYIHLIDGQYEFGVIVDTPLGPEAIKKGTAVKREEAEHLLQFIDEVLDKDGR
jgi:hypothetical protein